MQKDQRRTLAGLGVGDPQFAELDFLRREPPILEKRFHVVTVPLGKAG